MQSVSATLDTAIEAQEREPLARVRVDWDHNGNYTGTYDDITANVESVTVDRSISTDLPDAARSVTGYGAAESTVVLSGDLAAASMNVTRLLSPHDAASPLVATKRITAPIDVDFGMRGSVGEEYVGALIGQVRSLDTNVEARTVTLNCLDDREKFRGRTALPVIAADEKNPTAPFRKPNLSGSFFMDWVARANGYYSTPPQRSSCKLSATLRGSAWPEVGTFYQGYGSVAGAWAPMKFFQVGTPTDAERLYTFATATKLTYTPTAGLSTNNGAAILVEIDEFETNGSANESPIWTLTNAAGDAVSLWRTGATQTLQVGIRRNSAGAFTTTSTGPTLAAGTTAYLAVHVTFTSTGGTVTFRVNGTSTAVAYASGSITGRGDLTTCHVGALGYVSTGAVPGGSVQSHQYSGLQVTSEAAAGSFNDTFTATADIQPSIGSLSGTPMAEYVDDWELLNAAASAENGFVMLTEDGTLAFRNRAHMSGGAAVASISSLISLKSLNSVETIDAVRNRIRVPAKPVRLQVADTWVWIATDTYMIGSSASLTVFANVENLVYSLDTTMTFAAQSVGGVISTGGVYRAYPNADGTGAVATNVTGVITRVDHDTFKLVLTNPNAFDLYFVNPSTHPTDPAEPWLRLWGKAIVPTTSDADGESGGYLKAEVSDATSITAYREQTLELDESPWRQNSESAKLLADDLLAILKDPHPVLTNVEVVADPRLQLGDRVTVVEPDGTALDDDFWVIGINTTLDGAGMTQRLALRQA